MRVLILGGSSEASALAAALAGRADVAATLSLAGRVRDPAPQPVPTRVGSLGGVDGLTAILRDEAFDVLVDATHPFAVRMSANAHEAASRAGVPLLAVGRAPWRAGPGDRWRDVATMADAATALGAQPARVFLTIGRQQIAAFAAAPQHHYLVRSIEPVEVDHGLPDASFLLARGPFAVADEIATMRAHRIDVLVTKNSGGAASQAKLVAARELGLPVVLVRRPDERPVLSVAEALAAIGRMV